MSEKVTIEHFMGPAGISRGTFFSFRPNQKIHKIVISSGGEGNNNPIGMTFFSINEDGSTDTLTIGGGGTDTQVTRTDLVLLDDANEYLIGIRATFGPFVDKSPYDVLRSIKFITNVREFGPYGPNVGKSFTFQTTSKVVGFLGRSGLYINAIGAYSESIVE
nr:mannose/glucose-specific lectin-like [Ipomoea trifida]